VRKNEYEHKTTSTHNLQAIEDKIFKEMFLSLLSQNKIGSLQLKTKFING